MLLFRSLFWEEHYEIIPFEVEEDTNVELPHFHLPDDTEEKLRSSAFDSMDKTLTQVCVCVCVSSVDFE